MRAKGFDRAAVWESGSKMALVARPVAVASAGALVVGRGTSMRPIGAGEAAAIESIGPRIDVSADEGRFLFSDLGVGGRSGPKPNALSFRAARVAAPTQAFAIMFEVNQAGPDLLESMGPGAFGQFLSRATNLYETNARIIAGTHDKRGETLNSRF